MGTIVANIQNLAAAMVKAQASAQAVAKTSENKFHRYRYASAEALIEEGREALSGAGLALITLRWEVLPAATEGASSRVHVHYLLLHTSGESISLDATTSVLPEKGRPQDKAEATALTYNLGYFIRGLLLLPREEESIAVDQRDDRDRGYRHVETPPKSQDRIEAKQQVSSNPSIEGVDPTREKLFSELSSFNSFVTAIASAASTELPLIARQILKITMTRSEVDQLRQIWNDRKVALSKKEAA